MSKIAAKEFFKFTVSGTQKYAVASGFVEKFRSLKKVERDQHTEPFMPSREALRKHPFYLGLPPLSISDQLDLAAVDFLRENSVHSVKTLNQLSARLVSALHDRELLSEQQIVERVQRAAQKVDREDVGIPEERIDRVLRFHTDMSFSGARREERQTKKHSLSTWKSIR